MTKKEVLRKILLVFSCLWLSYISVKFLLGERDIFNIISICICYSILTLDLILRVVFKILHIISSYKLYKYFKSGLEYMKAVHTERYKLYFTGTKEKVEEYSTEIEKYGTLLLNVGQASISNNLLCKKHTQKVEEILKQAKILMTTIH